jgi:hypothetical protein
MYRNGVLFMRTFDINDTERIVELVRKRKSDAYVMPLYIKIYNERIDIRDIDEIDNYTPSSLKIGFGAVTGLFNKTNFPIKLSNSFDFVSRFTHYDDKMNTDYQYFVFESSDPYSNIDHDIFEQMSYYYWIFRNYLEDRMKSIRAKRIKDAMENN